MNNVIRSFKMGLWSRPTPIMLKKQNDFLSGMNDGKKYAIYDSEKGFPDGKTQEDDLMVVEHIPLPKGWRVLTDEEAESIRAFIVGRMNACYIFSASDVEKIAPFSGEYDVYECGVFSCTHSPTHVGLNQQTLSKEGTYPRRVRVYGEVEKDTLENGILYRKGKYDFTTVQNTPEDWGGWFSD